MKPNQFVKIQNYTHIKQLTLGTGKIRTDEYASNAYIAQLGLPIRMSQVRTSARAVTCFVTEKCHLLLFQKGEKKSQKLAKNVLLLDRYSVQTLD